MKHTVIVCTQWPHTRQACPVGVPVTITIMVTQMLGRHQKLLIKTKLPY